MSRAQVSGLALLLVIGAVLRAAPFLLDRSLWLDEAKLALNVLERSPAQLFGPLDYGQAAPVGFLLLEKQAVAAFGEGERALRLVPLLAGVASLWLFFVVARRWLSPAAGGIPPGEFRAARGGRCWWSCDPACCPAI